MEKQTQNETIGEIARKFDADYNLDLNRLCSSLKADGLNFNERVAFLGRVFEKVKPALQERIERMRREFEENPLLRKEYSKKYRAVDFIPVIGLITNETRANKLKDRNPSFYDWANYKFLKSRLESKAFTVYQLATTGLAIMQLSSYLFNYK